MKIVFANKYFFKKGGAERSFLLASNLLEKRGNEIVFFSMQDPRNDASGANEYFLSKVDYSHRDIKNFIKSSIRLLYSFEARRNIERLIDQENPNIAHLNNIYHQISPSIIHSLKKNKIPIVMSLRDYKLVCASYSMLAKGKPCEACKNGRYYNCLLKKCVKDSRAKSLLNTIEMYLHHKIMHIYDLVDVFISPSLFLKNKLEEMGFKGKIVHLPNFVNLDEYEPEYNWEENSIVYFGRLSKEKGVGTLIEAVKGLDITLKIIGDGPERQNLEMRAEKGEMKNVKFLGYLQGDALKDEIRKSMFVILPSECYENNPRSIIEGFALGKPALGAKIGGIPELVKEGETGLTFEPGNEEDLKEKISLFAGQSEDIVRFGKQARFFVEKELNEEKHYQSLMGIYNSLLP